MVSCAHRGCSSRDGVDKKKSSGITFHRFPKDPVRCKVWSQFVNRGTWKPTKYSVLCSKHFSEMDIDRTSKCYVRLKDNAVPTLNPFMRSRNTNVDIKIEIEKGKCKMFNTVIKNEDEYDITNCDIKSETDKGKNEINSLSSISLGMTPKYGNHMFEPDAENTNLKRENLSSCNEDEETLCEFKEEEVIVKSESKDDESNTDHLPSASVNKEPDDSDEVLKKELSFSRDDEIVWAVKTEELILKTELDDSGPE